MLHRSAALVLLAILSAPLTASAESDELARGHYLAGQSYYEQARYPEAIREFEEAFRLSPRPELLYNIAQAHDRMGHLDQAVAHLRRYLAAGPGRETRPAVEERLRNLEERLARTAVRLRSAVVGATVAVDGRPAGQTPLGPIRVAPGSHQVRVSKEGFEPFTAFVVVSAGNEVEVDARLTPQPSQLEPTQPAASAPAARRRYLWSWTAAGTAAALLVACAVTGGLALKRADDAGAPSNQDPGKADSARRLALASDITLGVGLGAAVAAAVLFLYERKPTGPGGSALAPMLGPRGGGVLAAWSF